MFLNFEGRGTGTGYARTAPQAGTRQGQGHLIDARGTLHAAYRDAPGTHASGTLRATQHGVKLHGQCKDARCTFFI